MGRFQSNQRGGIANIDSSGKITWSGWGGTLGATGAQSQFSSGKEAIDRGRRGARLAAICVDLQPGAHELPGTSNVPHYESLTLHH
jgi:hypothetical protein